MSLGLSVLLAIAAVLYTLSGVSHLFYMARHDFGLLARWSTRAAFALQSVGLFGLVWETGHIPVHTLFELTTAFTWLLVFNYIVIEVWRDNQAAGSFLMPAIAMLQIFAVALPKQQPTWVGQLSVSLIVWHVGVTMLGYGFFLAAFIAGALYLLQERNLRLKRWGPLYYRLPSLETLDIWSGRFVAIGFPLMTFGMAAGLSFAHVTWATFWHSDPKVIFTFLIWLVYGGYLLMRQIWGWGGRKAAWWSVAGVAAIFINYFLINLFSRLHRFGV
jgi:ABC-type transport system involved in cytochrome c biogenesis permease subunit